MKTKKYIFASHLVNIGTLICIGLFFLVIYLKNTPALYVVMVITGIINLSIFSVCYEFAVEIAFPVSEAMSAGIVNLFAMFLGFTLTIILTFVIKDRMTSVITIILLAGL